MRQGVGSCLRRFEIWGLSRFQYTRRHVTLFKASSRGIEFAFCSPRRIIIDGPVSTLGSSAKNRVTTGWLQYKPFFSTSDIFDMRLAVGLGGFAVALQEMPLFWVLYRLSPATRQISQILRRGYLFLQIARQAQLLRWMIQRPPICP